MQEKDSVSEKEAVAEEKVLKSNTACIIYAQATAIAIILISILVIRFVMPDMYTKIRKSYIKYFTVETSVDEALPDMFGVQGDTQDEI